MDNNLFRRILRDKNHILHADRRRSFEYELIDLVVMIENWNPKSTPWLRVTFWLDNFIKTTTNSLTLLSLQVSWQFCPYIV